MKLRFAWRALDDLIRLRAFIAKDNPNAARRISNGLRRSIKQLIDKPLIGTALVFPFGVRRWVAGPYVVHYLVDGQFLTVLRVWHGREQRVEA